MDDEQLARVSEVLGTRGLKATVDKAFVEVLAVHARRELAKQLASMHGLDLQDQEVMKRAWE